MAASWADEMVGEVVVAASAPPRPTRPSYIPPALRNKPLSADAPEYSPISSAGRDFIGSSRSHRSRIPEPSPFEIVEKLSELGFSDGAGINFDAYDDIPVETSGTDVPQPVNTFAEIDLGDALNENIKRCKYVKPTPVQRYAIPISLAGRDLMACAQTGSGKTAAFCFPIISGVFRHCGLNQRPPVRKSRMAYPIALILSPTRELSSQVRIV